MFTHPEFKLGGENSGKTAFRHVTDFSNCTQLLSAPNGANGKDLSSHWSSDLPTVCTGSQKYECGGTTSPHVHVVDERKFPLSNKLDQRN